MPGVVGVAVMRGRHFLHIMRCARSLAEGTLPQEVNFAVNAQAVKSFLDLYKVPCTTGASYFTSKKSSFDLAEEARK
jgi:hypothetical protein